MGAPDRWMAFSKLVFSQFIYTLVVFFVFCSAKIILPRVFLLMKIIKFIIAIVDITIGKETTNEPDCGGGTIPTTSLNQVNYPVYQTCGNGFLHQIIHSYRDANHSKSPVEGASS